MSTISPPPFSEYTTTFAKCGYNEYTMSHRQILVLVGILIITLPVLGFPMLWKQILLALVGVGIIYFAFKSSWRNSPLGADTYSESNNNVV